MSGSSFNEFIPKITGIKKNRRNHYKKSGQSILDFVLVFIAVAVLAVGIVRIWVWFNSNYASREVAYQQSRIVAGTPKSSYDEPIDIGATPDEPEMIYSPLDLTEEWVFQGIPSGQVTGELGGFEYVPPDEFCKRSPPDGCLGVDDCGDTLEEFNIHCPCFIQCVCNMQIQAFLNMSGIQIIHLRDEAGRLRDNADSMRDTAEECDDPWEICWWGNWGKTPGQLRRAACQLDWTADDLDIEADNLEQACEDMQGCCQEETMFEQDDCLEEVQFRTDCTEECTSSCHETCSEYDRCDFFERPLYIECRDTCYDPCYNTCLDGGEE